jgi:hypothetical protein
MESLQQMIDRNPPPFNVICVVSNFPGSPKPSRHRVGGYLTIEKAREAIEADRKRMLGPNPLDSLIGRTPKHTRTYRIHKAQWTLVE